MSDDANDETGCLPVGFVLGEDQTQQWVQCAYEARMCGLVLERIVDPKPKSALDYVDRLYGKEKVSTWTRSYLRAAAEHLGLWADLVAPYTVTPGATNPIRLRPYLLLGRGGLESASYALWLLEASNVQECVKRFVQLMRSDFELHKKARIAGELDWSTVGLRLSALESPCAELSLPVPSPRPQKFADLVRHAAKVSQSDPDRWAYVWNTASGAGHGQNWIGVEGFSLLAKHEYEPGHYRMLSVPDPLLVTETLAAACKALHWGTIQWLRRGGHDHSVIDEAMRDVHERMPKKVVEQSSNTPEDTNDER
jgi:hypothetical protein